MAGASALGGGRTAAGPLSQPKSEEQAAGFTAVNNYVALPGREAFNIEYWALEEAKLQRMPPPKELTRRVCLIVGGGSGIGRSVALKAAALGAHLVIADVNESAAAGHGAGGRPHQRRRRSGGLRGGHHQPRRHPPHDPVHGPALRRPRHPGQHRRHVPLARPRRPDQGRAMALDVRAERDRELPARRRSRHRAAGPGHAGRDRAHEFGQRGGAEEGERGVRRQQERRQPPRA